MIVAINFSAMLDQHVYRLIVTAFTGAVEGSGATLPGTVIDVFRVL